MVRALRAPQPEILRYINHVADRFDLRRDIQLNTRVTRPPSTSRQPLDAQDRRRRRDGAQFCIMATGCLSAPTCPSFQGLETLPGPVVPHRPVAARGRRLHGPARRRDRHRLVGHPVDPDDRRAGRAPHVFQRTPNFSLPARNAPLDPPTSAQGRLPSFAAAATRRSAIGHPQPTEGRRSRCPTTSGGAYEAAGTRAAFSFLYAYTDLLVTRRPTTPRRVRPQQDPRDREGPGGPPSCSAPKDHPDRHQAALPRHRLLRDVQPRQRHPGRPRERRRSRRSRRPASARHGRVRARCIVFATGFDAMTGALRASTSAGARARRCARSGRTARAPTSGSQVAGFPNLFIDHRPGSPSVLSNMIVSIEQHVDWIADCLDYLCAPRLSTIEPPSRPRTPGSSTSTRSASTLYPLGQLLVHGRQHFLPTGFSQLVRVDLGDVLGDARRAVVFELHGIHRHDELAHVVAGALEQHFAGVVAVHVDRADQPRHTAARPAGVGADDILSLQGDDHPGRPPSGRARRRPAVSPTTGRSPKSPRPWPTCPWRVPAGRGSCRGPLPRRTAPLPAQRRPSSCPRWRRRARRRGSPASCSRGRRHPVPARGRRRRTGVRKQQWRS